MFGKQLRYTTELAQDEEDLKQISNKKNIIELFRKTALKGYFIYENDISWSKKFIENLQLDGFKKEHYKYISWSEATTGIAKELYDLTMEARLKKYDEHIDYIKKECMETAKKCKRSCWITRHPYHPNVFKWLKENDIQFVVIEEFIELTW